VLSGSEVRDGALVSEVDHEIVSRFEFELVNAERCKTMLKRNGNKAETKRNVFEAKCA